MFSRHFVVVSTKACTQVDGCLKTDQQLSDKWKVNSGKQKVTL